METVTVNIENLCVPCYCACRHCLLSSKHYATGIDYSRGEKLAKRFYDWLKIHRPEISGMYYIGYCMDTPELTRWIRFNKHYNPWFNFLQFNGLNYRTSTDLTKLLRDVMGAGIEMIDLTFFGLASYHDRFAGRKGDFQWLLQILDAASAEGLAINGSICLTKENIDQIPELIQLLRVSGLKKYILFLPHSKGRGKHLKHLRLTAEELNALPEDILLHFMKTPHLTQEQWLSKDSLPLLEKRNLTLSLTPDNIEMLEGMTPEEMLEYIERKDDLYYHATPTAEELAQMYGDPSSHQLYRYRDLLLQWQQEYWQAHILTIDDMNDERYDFSIHI